MLSPTIPANFNLHAGSAKFDALAALAAFPTLFTTKVLTTLANFNAFAALGASFSLDAFLVADRTNAFLPANPFGTCGLRQQSNGRDQTGRQSNEAHRCSPVRGGYPPMDP
jgi:hypothetical protein